jgi:predicted NACHT family NTPase
MSRELFAIQIPWFENFTNQNSNTQKNIKQILLLKLPLNNFFKRLSSQPAQINLTEKHHEARLSAPRPRGVIAGSNNTRMDKTF